MSSTPPWELRCSASCSGSQAEDHLTGSLAVPSVTEAQVRNILETSMGVAIFERWIADQPWQKVAGGWRVTGTLSEWRFCLSVVPSGVQVSATSPRLETPAVWTVLGRS